MEKVDRIGNLLVQEGLISEEKLEEALEKQQSMYGDKPLGEVLIDLNMIKENEFLRILAKQFRTQYVTTEKLAALTVPDAILRLVPQNIAEKHNVLPIQYSSKSKSLSIVTTDPMNVGAIDDIKFVSGIGNIKALVAIDSAVRAGIDKFYKGNDRAFDMSSIGMDEDEGTGQGFSGDQGYGNIPMMSSNEMVIEPEGDEEGRGPRIEIEPEFDDEGFAKTESRPPKVKKDIEIDFGKGSGDDSVFLGGLEEFPGDDNLKRGGSEQLPSVEVEPDDEDKIDIGALSSSDGEEKKEEEAKVAAAAKTREKVKEAKKYHRKMLVVEPHDQIRKFITKLFSREGYEVQGVADRENVFATVENEEFDVVVIKEKSAGEGVEFEEKLKSVAPNIEAHIIKDYGSAMIGETRLYYKLIESFFESLDVIIGLLEMDRAGYQGHTHQVAKYSKLIGQKMGISRQDLHETVMGAYVHDLGKKGMTHYTVIHLIEDDVDKERLKDAIEIPVKLLNPANLPMDLDRVISNSLERFDGKGYPGKSKGEEIPVSSRILAAVDSFAFLTAEGWNDRKFSIPDAIAFLQEHSGTLFDPQIVDMFTQVIKDDMFVGMMDSAKEHIMIIDHEADLATLLELKFVNAGYRVSTARNGKEAIEKATTNTPDFILVEIELPEIDGFEFIERLQKTEAGEVPFLYLSANDDPKLIDRAFGLGAEDIITKPVRTEVLFAKVNRIMERIKRAKKAASKGATSGVSGNLSEMSLPDIVQILGAGRRTCKLVINHDSEQADIIIEEGHIVNAIYNEMKGEEAFYAIIGWDTGNFSINPEVEITERLINKSNDSLMLEGFRRLDEGKEGAGPDDISVDGSDFF